MKTWLFYVTAILLPLFNATGLYAQQVSGNINDKVSGKPLPATITAPNNNMLWQCSNNGRFSLRLPKPDSLHIFLDGYAPVVVAATGKPTRIKLVPVHRKKGKRKA